MAPKKNEAVSFVPREFDSDPSARFIDRALMERRRTNGRTAAAPEPQRSFEELEQGLACGHSNPGRQGGAAEAAVVLGASLLLAGVLAVARDPQLRALKEGTVSLLASLWQAAASVTVAVVAGVGRGGAALDARANLSQATPSAEEEVSEEEATEALDEAHALLLTRCAVLEEASLNASQLALQHLQQLEQVLTETTESEAKAAAAAERAAEARSSVERYEHAVTPRPKSPSTPPTSRLPIRQPLFS